MRALRAAGWPARHPARECPMSGKRCDCAPGPCPLEVRQEREAARWANPCVECGGPLVAAGSRFHSHDPNCPKAG